MVEVKLSFIVVHPDLSHTRRVEAVVVSLFVREAVGVCVAEYVSDVRAGRELQRTATHPYLLQHTAAMSVARMCRYHHARNLGS